jgi:HPt (histidine-containing phosphotransfer) domain-containing protein
MTAHAMQGDREKCLAVGMVDYLTKPVEVAALVAALEQWLPRSITDTSTSTRGSFAGPTSSGPAKADAPAPNPAPNDATRSSSPVAEAQPPGIVFDRATFLDRLVGDEALAARITEGFLNDIPAQMERLKEHAAAGRVQDACALAHKIKGAAGTVGGQCMMAVALDIEQAAKADQIEGVVRRLPDLDAEFERLKKAMKPENL